MHKLVGLYNNRHSFPFTFSKRIRRMGTVCLAQCWRSWLAIVSSVSGVRLLAPLGCWFFEVAPPRQMCCHSCLSTLFQEGSRIFFYSQYCLSEPRSGYVGQKSQSANSRSIWTICLFVLVNQKAWVSKKQWRMDTLLPMEHLTLRDVGLFNFHLRLGL